MSGKVGSFIIAAVAIGVAIATGNPALAISVGLGLIRSALFGLSERRRSVQGNAPSPRAPLPVIYGETLTGIIPVDIRQDPNNKDRLYIVGAVCHGSADGSDVEGVQEIFLDKKLAWTVGGGVQSPFSGTLTVTLHEGSSTQTHDTGLNGAFPTEWPVTSDGRGVCYVVLRMDFDQEIYSGIPNVTVKVRGSRVFDFRDSTWKYSTNPALCLYDYISSGIYGKGVPASEIDASGSWTTMANYYDEVVNTTGGGDAPRFSCDGFLDTGRLIEQNILELLTSCRGNLILQGGKFHLLTKRVVTPTTFELTEDNIVGDIEYNTPSGRDAPNTIEIVHTDPDQDYQASTRMWPRPGGANAFLTADNGFPIKHQIDLPFTQNPYTAEQVGMVMMREARAGLTFSVVATEEALQLAVGDLVPVTHSSPGWTQKDFWVMGVLLNLDATLSLVLQDYDANAYSLDAQSQIPSVPGTNLPDPFTVGAPTALLLTSDDTTSLPTPDGAAIQRIQAQWTAPSDPFIDYYEVQVHRATEADFKPMARVPADITPLETFVWPVSGGEQWTVRVRGVNTIGRHSTWLTSSITVPLPKLPPRLPQSLILNGDFESGGPLIDDPDSGWEIQSGDNTNITYDTTTAINGTRSLKVAVPTSGARRIRNRLKWLIMPGQSAGFSAIGRLANTNMGTGSCSIVLSFRNSADSEIGSKSVFFSTTVNTYKQVIGAAPAGTVTVDVVIRCFNASVAGDFFIDDVAPLIELSDLPPWAPTLFPTTPLAPPTTPPLLPRNPKLGQHSGEAGINLLQNGDASDGLTNWDSQDGQVYGDGWVTRLGLAFDPIGKGNGGPTVVEVSDAVVGGSVFRFDGITRKMSSEQIIPVNPNLWYELTATLIRRSSTAATSEYIMLTPLDKDGRKIEPWEWRNGGSEKRTQVNGALSGGETTITVDDGSQFGSDGPLTNVYIALNADSTAGGYSDLPNRETFKLASRSGNVLTIDSGTFPAVADNTWVRRHVSSSAHLYVAASNYNMHAEALDTPVEHSGEIGPHASSVIAPWSDPSGAAAANAFPQGTKYVRVGCLINNGGAATAQIDLDRFIFRRKNDARDTREVDASSVGRDGADKNLPAGTKVGDGAVFLGVTKGVEVWEAEHNDVVVFVGGPYQVAPVIRVLGGLGWQPEAVWGTRAQADSAQAAGSAAANTGVAHWPLKRGEGITATQCTVAALLEEVKTTLLPRSVTLSGANLTAVSQSTTTDLGIQLPADNDTFRFDYTTRVVAAVNTKLTPNWCEVVMTVDCEIDDGTGFAVYSSQDYEEYAEGLGNTSDSGTVNRSDTFQAAGIVDNDDARMAISATAITGNPLTGSIVHEVNQGSVNWDEATAGVNEYARATDPQHKVTVLVIPATNLQTA